MMMVITVTTIIIIIIIIMMIVINYHGSHIDLHIESPPTWHFKNTQPCTGVWDSSVDIQIMESSGIQYHGEDSMKWIKHVRCNPDVGPCLTSGGYESPYCS